jgi:hypothetical protein
LKFRQTKTFAISIVIILAISIGTSTTLIPNASAHAPAWEIPTYPYITAAPNPVGVGQTVNVFMFLTNYYYGAQYSTDDLRFHNYKLTITAPNGEVSTQTYDTIIDTTAAQLGTFIPNQVGTYNLTFNYPGETYTSTRQISTGLGQPAGPNPYTNDTFLASSASTTLTVQEEPIPDAITSYPLPSEYWTRPIYGENTDWWSISSNWLGTGAPNYGGWSNAGNAQGGGAGGQQVFPGDAIGSQTSHIMWTNSLQSGGVVGGNNFDIQGQTFFDGSAYIIRYDNPIILDGKLYYTEPVSFNSPARYGTFGNPASGYGPTDCVDLRTGEIIWSRTDVPAPSFGLIMNVQTQNEHGVCPPILIAISGTTWLGYDADTGNWLFNVTKVPTFGSARVMGPDGEYLNYVMANAGDATNPDWRLGQWNSTKLFLPGATGSPVMTGVKDGSVSTGTNTLYDWNVSISWRNTMSTAPTIVAAKYGDGILCYNGTLPSNGENMNFPTVSQTPYTYFFVNLDASKGAVGSVSWWKTNNPPANNYTVVQAGVDWNSRVFLQSLKEGIMWSAYSLDSGEHLWTSEPQAAFDYYGSPNAGLLSGQIAYGKLYSCAMAGILYCYDMKTGTLLWTYGNGGEGNSTNSGFAWPYGNIPTFVQAIGNDVVYLITSEHTWTTPIYKGGLARAVNATSGEEIWTVSSVTMEFGSTSYAMADGYNTWFNGYDNKIYVVGRGPSSTAVTASPKVQIQGTSIHIEGTVTDISSGTTQDEQSARFPNGVPVSSDASMKDWMGYVYQQKPQPSSFTGVTVSIAVLDSNNNYRNIGTTTTDATGRYSISWLPDISGDFTVFASFAGTNGYWPSFAETSFTVDPAAPTPAPTAAPQQSTADLYFVPAIAGLFVAIVIVGALLALLLIRKRP